MGKLLRLAGITLTDTTAPKIFTRDTIESAGSLFLLDVSSQFGAFVGVPTNGGSIPNVVAPLACKILGLPVGNALAASVISTGDSVGNFLLERTGKGGLHGISSQVSQVAAHNCIAELPAELRDYIYSNRASNSFYVSAWSKVTRSALNSVAQQSLFDCSNNVSNYLFHTSGGPFSPAVTGAGLGRKVVPAAGDSTVAIPSDRFVSGGAHGVTGIGPDSTSAVRIGLGAFGAWSSFNVNKAPSRVIYRWYIEDLTVSGRTYAEVEALDYALFLEAFAPGGKFYGDTYTAPSTLP